RRIDGALRHTNALERQCHRALEPAVRVTAPRRVGLARGAIGVAADRRRRESGDFQAVGNVGSELLRRGGGGKGSQQGRGSDQRESARRFDCWATHISSRSYGGPAARRSAWSAASVLTLRSARPVEVETPLGFRADSVTRRQGRVKIESDW